MLDFCLSFWAAPSTATVTFSLPLLVLEVTVANSSVDGGAGFLDRVAVRKLCSREERMRKNGFVPDSGAGWDIETFEKLEGCWEREEEACETGPGLRWFVIIWKGPETVIFALCNGAAAIGEKDGEQRTTLDISFGRRDDGELVDN